MTRWDQIEGSGSFYAAELLYPTAPCFIRPRPEVMWILDQGVDGAFTRRPGGPFLEARTFFDSDGDGLVEAVRVAPTTSSSTVVLANQPRSCG